MPIPRTTARLIPFVAAVCALATAAVVPAAAAQSGTATVPTATAPSLSIVPAFAPIRLEADLAVAPGRETCLPVAGTRVPDDATGVFLNVTTVAPSGDGYVVVYPSGPVPTGSTVNFDPGRDVANAAFVPLGPDGAVCYRTHGAARAGVLVDLTGFTMPGSGVELQAPQRLLDTRPGWQVGHFEGPVQERTPFDVQVAGVGGVPEDAESVILNVTVTGPLTEGNLRVYPGGAPVPEASVVNFAPLGTRAAATIVRLSDVGTISIFSDSPIPAITSQVQVIIDVMGWTTPGSPYTAMAPSRVLDTRTGLGRRGMPSRIPGQQGIAFEVTGDTGVPAGATAVALQLAAVHPSGPGNLRVHAAGTQVPPTSTINYVPAIATANVAIVPIPAEGLPTDGLITLWSDSAGSVDVVADVIGYVGAQALD